jgi:hypothetical protein
MSNKTVRILFIISALLILVLLFLTHLNLADAATVPYRIRMPSSTYSAQLKGKTGTRTTGLTISGSYSSTFKAHQFTVVIAGYYDLWFDAAGGTNYSKDASWSGSDGKFIPSGYFDDAIDADLDYKVDAIDDSVVALSNLTTAAYNFISSGGSVTNNPDDVTLENKAGSTIGIKSDYLIDSLIVADTTALKLINSANGRTFNMLALSGTNYNGDGLIVAVDSTDLLAAGLDSIPLGVVFYAHPSTDVVYARQSFLKDKIVNIQWAGAWPDSTNSTATRTAINKAIRHAYKIGTHKVYAPPGQYALLGGWTWTMPNTELYGHMHKTIFYDEDASAGVFANHPYSWSQADFDDRQIYLHDFTVYGYSGFSGAQGSGNDGGIFTGADGGVSKKHVRYENLRLYRIDMEGLLAWSTVHAEYIGNYVEDCAFTAYSPANIQHLTFIGNTAHDCFAGIEHDGSIINVPAGEEDSLSSSVIKGNSFSNIHYYCLKIAGATEKGSIIIEGNQFLGSDSTQSGLALADGIYITVFANQLPTKSLKIHNNIFAYNRGRGIYMEPDSLIDFTRAGISPKDRIEYLSITDNTIIDAGFQAILLKDTLDVIERCVIEGNTIRDWNRHQTASSWTFSGIMLQELDSAVVRNNTIWSTRTLTAAGGAVARREPIYLAGCDEPVIIGNDFRNQDFSDRTIVIDTETKDSLNWIIRDNEGLYSGGHIRWWNPDPDQFYMQDSWHEIDGFYLSERTGDKNHVLQTFFRDSLVFVRFDSAHAVVDTTFPMR